MKYTFSGHESFTCKTLWLKKGYDFMNEHNDFNDPEAVVTLGVGKNMVAAIRYWMKAFGMSEDEQLAWIARYLLDSQIGKDPYIESLGTLWLLHYLLVSSGEATIYNWTFVRLQRERNIFDRPQAIQFVRRLFIEDNKLSAFNENTIKKDLGVLLQNYVLPMRKDKSLDDYNALLIDLDLIRSTDGKNYRFNTEGKRQIPWQIFLYALLKHANGEKTLSYDMLQELGLMFCMTDLEVIEMCQVIESHYPKHVRYSDTAGIKQIQFINEITEKEALDNYYD